jgi:hypothetical protein
MKRASTRRVWRRFAAEGTMYRDDSGGAAHGRRDIRIGIARLAVLSLGITRVAVLSLVAALMVGGSGVRAESVFARDGIGEWLEEYDIRGAALGSTGIGVIDIHNFASLNPASTAFSKKSMGYAGVGSMIRWTSDGTDEARRPSTFLTGLGAHVALSNGIGVRLTVSPATDGGYVLQRNVPTGWEDVERDVRREEGSRGLLRYAASVSWAAHDRLALAAGAGIYAGSLLDETSYEFGDSALARGWRSCEDQMRLRFRPASYFHAGALLRPIPRVSIGGFVVSRARSEVTGTYESFADKSAERVTNHLDLPLGYGAGAAVLLGQRWRVSGDLVARQWEEVELDDLASPWVGVGPFRNTLRWGAGIERLGSPDPRASYLSSIAWRAGYAVIPWYIQDASGDGVDEWRVSFGAGLPVQRDRGSLDIALSWGHRGSEDTNGIEEKYFRFEFATVFASVPRGY